MCTVCRIQSCSVEVFDTTWIHSPSTVMRRYGELWSRLVVVVLLVVSSSSIFSYSTVVVVISVCMRACVRVCVRACILV